eukprot:2541530-Rhodomonas_salina.1
MRSPNLCAVSPTLSATAWRLYCTGAGVAAVGVSSYAALTPPRATQARYSEGFGASGGGTDALP